MAPSGHRLSAGTSAFDPFQTCQSGRACDGFAPLSSLPASAGALFSGIKVARAPSKDEARVGRASLLLLVLGHRRWLTGGVGEPR